MFKEKTEIGYFNPANEGFKSLLLLLNIKHMYLQKQKLHKSKKDMSPACKRRVVSSIF